MGTVIFPANIARTCCMPNGIVLFIGSFWFGLPTDLVLDLFDAIYPPSFNK